MTADASALHEIATPSLRAALKAATRALHEALDGALVSAFHDRAKYAAYLRASHAVAVPIEASLVAFGLVPGETRAAAIADDLRALEARGAKAAEPWPLATAAAAFGAAYVVEGSTLGGLVLARIVEDRLRTRATRFLRLRGERTGLAFKSFVAALDGWGASATPTEIEATKTSAARVFRAWGEALVREGAVEDVAWPTS